MKPRLPSTSIGYVEQVLLLALVSSLIAFSIDAMLPALAHIERDLQVQDPNGRQYVVCAVFVCMAIGRPYTDFLLEHRPDSSRRSEVGFVATCPMS